MPAGALIAYLASLVAQTFKVVAQCGGFSHPHLAGDDPDSAVLQQVVQFFGEFLELRVNQQVRRGDPFPESRGSQAVVFTISGHHEFLSSGIRAARMASR